VNEGVLVWGLVFGSNGLFNFLYGKKVGNLVIRYTGVALMVYPYFFSNTIVIVAVGVGLMFLPMFVKV